MNKQQQEKIQNLKDLIASIDNNEQNEAIRDLDVQMLKDTLNSASFFENDAAWHFKWSVKALHNATEEGAYNLKISEDIEVAIKEMKKAEKKLEQAREFKGNISRLVHEKLEQMNI